MRKTTGIKLTELKQALNEVALVSVMDTDGTITYVNDLFCNISKYSREELLGQNYKIMKSGFHTPKFYKCIWDVISNGKIWRGEIKNLAKDGWFYWIETVILPMFDEHKKINSYILVGTDITDQKNLISTLESTNQELEKNEKEIKTRMQEAIQGYTLEKELMESNAALKSEKKFANQKDEFAAMVSHELKTPIFPIKMHCEMLKDPKMLGKLTPAQLESVDQIELMANQLDSLTGDILDSQKLEMKKMKFSKIKIKLSEFFDEIKNESQSYVIEKDVSITFDISDLEIHTDRQRLAQIFSNMIRNAVIFVAKKTGKIMIKATTMNEDILFSVKDNGVGIPSDKIVNLFRKFYQIDASLKRIHDGTGLGLVICKGLVEGLGGKIWVESEVNKGTTFYFTLPIKEKSYNYITGPRNPLLEILMNNE